MAKNSPNNTNSFYYDPYYTDGNYASYDDGVGGGVNNVDGTLVLRRNTGVFGIPYQFLESVDRRLDNNNQMAGRKYTEKILTRLPLLFLVPCKQQFMEGFSSDDQAGVITDLINGVNTYTSQSLSANGRYYTTAYQYDEYYAIVNRMCTVMAHYMGLGDVEFPNGSGGVQNLANISWENMVSPDFKNYFQVKRSTVFYCDGMTSISDSFNNSTMESSLGSTINGFSDTAKEINFLLGDNSLISRSMDVAGDVITGLTGSTGTQSLLEKLTGGMIGDLATTGVSTVLAGGKLIFPKIWSDSSFSRSYSFDIKLRSPDHDSLSI